MGTVSEQTGTTGSLLPSRLEDIDKQFVEHAMPVRLRPLEAFKLLHGSVQDGELRNSLFGPIIAWFTQRYGDRAQWDGIVARVPILLRGNLYLLAIPFITSGTALQLTDYIEDLPQEVPETMTREEFSAWGEKAMLAAFSVYKIYNLSIDDLQFSNSEREMLRRALFDLENASILLKMNEDTQGAIFNAHAASEKFLKIGLRRAGITATRHSHKLDKEIFKELVRLRPTYAWLEPSISALSVLAPNMNIRYQAVPRTTEDALSAIYISLHICSTLAQTWLFDFERGTEKSQFSPGNFYLDGRRATFYCDRLCTTRTGKPGAVLMAFADIPLRGPVIAELVFEQEHSSLYLEVTDSLEADRLKSQFEILRQKCQSPVDPKVAGISIHSGPEGSYVGGTFHIQRKES
jgi:hypothetical protein